MSLPDSAEYWQDVKRNYPYTGKQFYHIPGADCGHRHLHEAKKLGNINCFACLELIKNGYDHGLEEGTYLTRSERKHQAAINKRNEFNEKYGKCSCGCEWVIRKNKSTGQEFLGCNNYPKCKNTKPIKQTR